MKRHDVITAPCGDGGPVMERMVRAGRVAVLVFLIAASLLALACTEEPPSQIARGEDIEIGPYAFRVLRARNAPNPPPPISTFRSQPGRKGIVVFVYWKALGDDMDVVRRLAFIESFFQNQLSIADSDGKHIEVLNSMQEKLMYMQDPGPNWRDWVVVFFVPDESRDLTLLVENPEPREGQPRRIAVPLGM